MFRLTCFWPSCFSNIDKHSFTVNCVCCQKSFVLVVVLFIKRICSMSFQVTVLIEYPWVIDWNFKKSSIFLLSITIKYMYCYKFCEKLEFIFSRPFMNDGQLVNDVFYMSRNWHIYKQYTCIAFYPSFRWYAWILVYFSHCKKSLLSLQKSWQLTWFYLK